MRRDGGRTPSYPHSPLGEKNKLPLVSAHHTHVLGNFFFILTTEIRVYLRFPQILKDLL